MTSTINLPNILSNVTGRVLAEAYTQTVAGWSSFATIKSAADFKPQSSIRPSAFEALQQLPPNGELAHATIKEEAKYDWSIDTFGRMLGVDRRDIINDDLRFFDEVAPMLGQAAGRSLNDLVARRIMAISSVLTTGSALAIASLNAAIVRMRKQTDAQGNSIDIPPTALAVPPELEATARAILNSTEVLGTTGPNGNPMKGIVPNLVVEPRFSNTTFVGNSVASHYLFGGPLSQAVIIGFLNGQQTPTVKLSKLNSIAWASKCEYITTLVVPSVTRKQRSRAAEPRNETVIGNVLQNSISGGEPHETHQLMGFFLFVALERGSDDANRTNRNTEAKNIRPDARRFVVGRTFIGSVVLSLRVPRLSRSPVPILRTRDSRS